MDDAASVVDRAATEDCSSRVEVLSTSSFGPASCCEAWLAFMSTCWYRNESLERDGKEPVLEGPLAYVDKRQNARQLGRGDYEVDFRALLQKALEVEGGQNASNRGRVGVASNFRE